MWIEEDGETHERSRRESFFWQPADGILLSAPGSRAVQSALLPPASIANSKLKVVDLVKDPVAVALRDKQKSDG